MKYYVCILKLNEKLKYYHLNKDNTISNGYDLNDLNNNFNITEKDLLIGQIYYTKGSDKNGETIEYTELEQPGIFYHIDTFNIINHTVPMQTVLDDIGHYRYLRDCLIRHKRLIEENYEYDFITCPTGKMILLKNPIESTQENIVNENKEYFGFILPIYGKNYIIFVKDDATLTHFYELYDNNDFYCESNDIVLIKSRIYDGSNVAEIGKVEILDTFFKITILDSIFIKEGITINEIIEECYVEDYLISILEYYLENKSLNDISENDIPLYDIEDDEDDD